MIEREVDWRDERAFRLNLCPDRHPYILVSRANAGYGHFCRGGCTPQPRGSAPMRDCFINLILQPKNDAHLTITDVGSTEPPCCASR